VRIAAGHDRHPFWNGAIEIGRMIAHGVSATEALVSATAGGAPALGLDAHVGSVDPRSAPTSSCSTTRQTIRRR
jgi:imidazolonepropionase-like amidohydrolase